MSKISDKTKLFMAVGLLEGLKVDLEKRLIKCPDCKWTLEYINYAISFLDDLSYGDTNE